MCTIQALTYKSIIISVGRITVTYEYYIRLFGCERYNVRDEFYANEKRAAFLNCSGTYEY